jgi:hypothetical protein
MKKQSNKGEKNTTKRKKMNPMLRNETIIDEKFESEPKKNERPLEMGGNVKTCALVRATNEGTIS